MVERDGAFEAGEQTIRRGIRNRHADQIGKLLRIGLKQYLSHAGRHFRRRIGRHADHHLIARMNASGDCRRGRHIEVKIARVSDLENRRALLHHRQRTGERQREATVRSHFAGWRVFIVMTLATLVPMFLLRFALNRRGRFFNGH